MIDNSTWADRLRRARRVNALTQRKLAARAGVSPSVVGMIETGYHASPESRRRIAAALYRRPSDLFPPHG